MEDFLRFFILFFFLNDEFRIYNRVVDLNKYFSFFYSKTKKLLELLILRSHKYKLLYAHILLLLITRVFKNYNITIINFFLFKFNYTIINKKKKKESVISTGRGRDVFPLPLIMLHSLERPNLAWLGD